MAETTHALLVQAEGDASEQPHIAANIAAAVRRHSSAAIARVHVVQTSAQRLLYAYVHFEQPQPMVAEMCGAFDVALAAKLPRLRQVRASRLQRAFDIAGASTGANPKFHYVVEMVPEVNWGEQLFEWYDVEHMPGLAAVPGCIHAWRYLNLDHGPLSHACYALVTAEAKGSPPWMAITDTAWSSRMRPHFTQTKRTMFDVVQG